MGLAEGLKREEEWGMKNKIYGVGVEREDESFDIIIFIFLLSVSFFLKNFNFSLSVH